MHDLINFMQEVGKLKKLKRTGWVLFKVPNAESVAEHSFRTAVLSMLLAERSGADVNKCTKMALVHDLGECIVGDITPLDGVSKEDKHQRELRAFEHITKDIKNKEIMKLWVEYEERRTPEALLVHDADKLEMLLQAYEYEAEHKENVDLNIFYDREDNRPRTNEGKAFYELLVEKRNMLK